MSSEDTSQFCVDLNIFTNCTDRYIPDAKLLIDTFHSFINLFGKEVINDLRIFIDPEPQRDLMDKYVKDLYYNLTFPHEVFITDGLADGYIMSTEVCTTDYIFQLEHDWEFLDTIMHSLNSLVKCMKHESMQHLRFNKRANINKPWDTLTPMTVLGCDFCKTPIRSNNPHIIDRKSYLTTWNNWIDLSNTPKRADGIENKMEGLGGYIYGKPQYPQQVKHTDGRK